MTEILEIGNSSHFLPRMVDGSDVMLVFGDQGAGKVPLSQMMALNLFGWLQQQRNTHVVVYPEHLGKKLLNHPAVFMSGQSADADDFDTSIGIAAISDRFEVENLYDYFWREGGHRYAAMAIVYISDKNAPGSFSMGIANAGGESNGNLGVHFDGIILKGLISSGSGFSVSAQPTWVDGLNNVAFQYSHDGTDSIVSLFVNGVSVATSTIEAHHQFSSKAGMISFSGSAGALLCFGCQWMGELTIEQQQDVFDLFKSSHVILPVDVVPGGTGGGSSGGGAGGGSGGGSFIINDSGHIVPDGILIPTGYIKPGSE